MSIYKRKSGRYTVVVAKVEGSTERRSLGTFENRKEAERAEREALTARDRGIDLAPRSATVADVVQRYLRDRKGRCEAKTLQEYENLAKAYILPHLAHEAAFQTEAGQYRGMAASARRARRQRRSCSFGKDDVPCAFAAFGSTAVGMQNATARREPVRRGRRAKSATLPGEVPNARGGSAPITSLQRIPLGALRYAGAHDRRAPRRVARTTLGKHSHRKQDGYDRSVALADKGWYCTQRHKDR